ncbi:hypothetical protein [Escherichia phage UPEC06]|nr:hypothetical protein [Escherichia phage UPEC06]
MQQTLGSSIVLSTGRDSPKRKNLKGDYHDGNFLSFSSGRCMFCHCCRCTLRYTLQ